MKTIFKSTGGVEYSTLDLVLIFSLLESLVEGKFDSPEQFYCDIKVLMESIIVSKTIELKT